MALKKMAKFEIVVDSLALLLDEDVEIYRKQAALLLLKLFVPKEMLEILMENNELYPFDRNDTRVTEWKNKVISKGKCEKCGSKKRLEAHHIIKWCEYPIGRIDVNNGMCLCHSCHTEEHKYDKSYHMMKAK